MMLITLAATLAAFSGTPDSLVQRQVECRGWINYHKDTDFRAGVSEFKGLARQNISSLAISLRGSETPIFVQAGGGTAQDQFLSERRAALVVDALAVEGIDADRVRVTQGKARQIAPDGLLVYGHATCG
ncbi:MAG TPA: hypothetical protein VF582_05470 [Allosphingosinicella sp.]